MDSVFISKDADLYQWIIYDLEKNNCKHSERTMCLQGKTSAYVSESSSIIERHEDVGIK